MRTWRATGYIKDNIQVITTLGDDSTTQLWCKACGDVTEMRTEDIGVVARSVAEQITAHVLSCPERT